MNILVTGGAGYIGSHCLVYLLEAGHNAVVLDNLANGHREALRRVERLTGRTFAFVAGDVLDRALLDRIFSEHDIEAVIHFAGLKAVAESARAPLLYYQNNVAGSITLFQAMQAAKVWRLVFSSSATVYGAPAAVPITEECPTTVPANPYGRSKLMVEQILQDMAAADGRWSLALLRYFNPAGAHPSGLLGEDPRGAPNNLTPYVSRVAIGKLSELSVFGNDYATRDGTGVRDYVHVIDLVKGHLAALDFVAQSAGAHIWNLGTGVGYSVLEVVDAFQRASGREIPYRIAPRRAGDVAECWCDPSKAARQLGWRAARGITEMMEDTWRWQTANRDGYR